MQENQHKIQIHSLGTKLTGLHCFQVICIITTGQQQSTPNNKMWVGKVKEIFLTQETGTWACLRWQFCPVFSLSVAWFLEVPCSLWAIEDHKWSFPKACTQLAVLCCATLCARLIAGVTFCFQWFWMSSVSCEKCWLPNLIPVRNTVRSG